MICRAIRKLSRTGDPPLFVYGRDNIWKNGYVSAHVLNAHMDSTVDDASRRPETIDRTVKAITRHTHDAPDNTLLDLGCGPGLHAERFAGAGYQVTGIDFSRRAISCARRTAGTKGLSIRYRRRDYLKSPLPTGFSVITLIYGSLCVISDRQRARLLRRIFDSLLPGGYLVFDVFTRDYVERQRVETDWYFARNDGFWHPGSHLVLEESRDFENGRVSLNSYTVIPAFGRVRTYRIWYRPHTHAGIRTVAAEAGFTEIRLCGNPEGSPFESLDELPRDDRQEWIGVFCRKPPASSP